MHQTRPALPDRLISRVTESLAHWLPSDNNVFAPRDWGDDEWLAAEWVTYWQNALPWLHQKITDAEIAMSDAARESIATIASASHGRTLSMLDSAAELIKALHDDGVDALPFKGALLAALYYPNRIIRPLADLDILVREKDIRTGIAVLERLGYRYYSRSAEDFVYLRGERKANVWRADNVHPVELHFRIREEYAGLAYDMSDVMWSSAARQPFWDDVDAWLPSLPIMLHHVCAHMSSDLFIQRGKLIHLGDVQLMASRMSEVDWEAFLASVPPHGARFVYTALVVSERYTLGAIPDAVLEALRVHLTPQLQDWSARATLADASESNPAPRSGIGFGMARLIARSRSERFQMLLRSLFPHRWNLVKRYPRLAASPFYPLCYVLINFDRAWKMFKPKV